jgi:hypothetical protein
VQLVCNMGSGPIAYGIVSNVIGCFIDLHLWQGVVFSMLGQHPVQYTVLSRVCCRAVHTAVPPGHAC